MARSAKRDRDEHRDAGQHVDPVSGRKYIEKAAAGIRRDANSRDGELAPADPKPREKKQAQDCCDAPPVAKSRVVVCQQPVPRVSQSEAAGQQDSGAKRKNTPRQIERLPIA